jgi:hypothetical protein
MDFLLHLTILICKSVCVRVSERESMCVCVCVSERVCVYVRVCVRVHFFVGVSRYHQLDWIRYCKCNMTNGSLTLKVYLEQRNGW